MKKISSLTFVVSLLTLSACSNSEYPQMEPAKTAVTEYTLSGNWEKDVRANIEAHKSHIEGMISSAQPGTKFAALFDIDETSLSNLRFWLRFQYGFDFKLWNAWINEADAVAIKPTLEFFNWLKTKGVHIYFYTGREQLAKNYKADPTIRNLAREGYSGYDKVIFKPQTKEMKADLAAAKNGDFKTAFRCKLATEGYNLLVSIGDQWSDHQGDCPAQVQIKLVDPLYTLPKTMVEIQKKYNYDPSKKEPKH
jgi:predicted secreted acid phosphatase